MSGFHNTLFLLAFTWTSTDAAFLFVQEPKAELYFREGSTAVFPWDYKVDNRTAEVNYISWDIFNKTTKAFDTLLYELSDGRVQYSSNVPPEYGPQRVTKEGRATLVIKNVTFKDTGDFSCVLSPKIESTINSRVTLIVTGSASIDQPIQYGEVGGHASFTCNATNVPSQNITWVREGQNYSRIVSGNKYEITSSGPGFSKLTIKDITISDHGFYVCDATVNANQPSSERGFLGVLSLYKCFDSCPNTKQSATMDELTTICCPVCGFPPPEVTWEFPDGTIQKAEDTILPITPKSEHDFGNYQCSAEGLQDPVTVTINLQEEGQKTEIKVGDFQELGQDKKLKWKVVEGAQNYICRIDGPDIYSNALVGDNNIRDNKNETSIEIPYSTLNFRTPDQKPNPVTVYIEILAMDEGGGILEKRNFTAEIKAAATTPGVSFILGVVLFMLVIFLQ